MTYMFAKDVQLRTKAVTIVKFKVVSHYFPTIAVLVVCL